MQIDDDADVQTVLTTFEVSPGTCRELLAGLEAAYEEVISRQPGFISAAIHVNDAETRIANYSRWRRREDFKAMLRSQEMQDRNRRFAGLARGFEPVLYEVAAVYAPKG